MDGNPELRILVVEDDPSVRRILVLQLRARGFLVESAVDGSEGFARLRESPPDCVLLDLMMPVMDGFELLKRIRTLDRTSGIPVVILTASEDEKHRMRGRQYLADAYLNKPFDIEELERVIRRLAGAPAKG